MGLTTCTHQMANLPGLAGGTGISISLIQNESRDGCHLCHLFQKSITNTESKKLSKLSGNPGNDGSPVQGVLGLMLIKPVFLPAIRVSGRV